MPDFIFLMHDDAKADEQGSWEGYIETLVQAGVFEGGSEIGAGICIRKSGKPASLSHRLTGYLRVKADNLDHAKSLLTGNPHYEAGGTVEIRELPLS